MPDLSDLLDSYERKARLLPGLLLAMPVGIAVVALLPGFDPKNLLGLLVAAGVPLFIANFIRSRGKRLETRLVKQWGGLPTTQMLRHREPTNNQRMFQRRRQGLEALLEETLPTPEQEAADPVAADEHYIAATKTLIARVRETKESFPLVKTELTNYGFRRNLAGVKPLGIIITVLLLGVDGAAILAGADLTKLLVAAAIHLGCVVAWLTVVRHQWIREQADSYAERLFDTLEEPTFTTPARTE